MRRKLPRPRDVVRSELAAATLKSPAGRTLARRSFLVALGLGTAMVGTGCGRTPVAAPTASAPPLRLLPSEPGVLTPAEAETLWAYYQGMARLWEMPATELSRRHFDAFLHAKTAQPPSYLREYRSAIGELERVGGARESLRSLFRLVASTDAGAQHAKAYVVREFASLLIATGGLANHDVSLLFGEARLSPKLRAELFG